MTKWERYSEDWEEWNETLPSGKILLCHKHPPGFEYAPNEPHMGGGWVTVYSSRTSMYGYDTLEKHELPRGTGEIEFVCIMHEMRIKYG